MTRTRTTRAARLTRRLATVAVATSAVLLPLGTGTAQAAQAQAQAPSGILPPGVVQLADGEPCPWATLCLYRDYGQQGPAQGIGAGYDVDLRQLPMAGGVGGPSAADNVSSWVNRTASTAGLVDLAPWRIRPLFSGQALEEPLATNDSVDLVRWAN